MQKYLDFFYFLGSTYTYLAVKRAEQVAQRDGVVLQPTVSQPWRRWKAGVQSSPRLPYTAWFLENKDPGEVEHLSEILQRIGQDPEHVVAQANSEAVRDRYALETDVARNMGIFGSPTFACGAEIFWGDDRLEDAIEWCKAH